MNVINCKTEFSNLASERVIREFFRICTVMRKLSSSILKDMSQNSIPIKSGLIHKDVFEKPKQKKKTLLQWNFYFY